jgi:hypothetical protein
MKDIMTLNLKNFDEKMTIPAKSSLIDRKFYEKNTDSNA